MRTDLTRIGEKARKEPDLVFTSPYNHIYDVDNLWACYDTLEVNKATGIIAWTCIGGTIQQKKGNHVVEADVKSFFDKFNHDWMVKFVRHRIGDKWVIRLIIRMLQTASWKTVWCEPSIKGLHQVPSFRRCYRNIYQHC